MKTSVDEFDWACERTRIPRAAYRVVPGFYEDTLAKMPATQAPANIALAFADCDLYSSTKTVFKFLGPRMSTG
jgi:O-methyltransferase